MTTPRSPLPWDRSRENNVGTTLPPGYQTFLNPDPLTVPETEYLNCIHGRTGAPCPWCLGINQPPTTVDDFKFLLSLVDTAGLTFAPTTPALDVERLREALERIDALPAGHYRRNGFATPDPWVRQRDVHRIIRAALASEPRPEPEP